MNGNRNLSRLRNSTEVTIPYKPLILIRFYSVH